MSARIEAEDLARLLEASYVYETILLNLKPRGSVPGLPSEEPSADHRRLPDRLQRSHPDEDHAPRPTS